MKTEDWNDRHREDPTAAKRAGDNARKWEKANSGKPEGWREFTISASDLLGKEFPPINYVVPDIIAEGLQHSRRQTKDRQELACPRNMHRRGPW